MTLYQRPCLGLPTCLASMDGPPALPPCPRPGLGHDVVRDLAGLVAALPEDSAARLLVADVLRWLRLGAGYLAAYPR